jgi:hypothetical protein
MSTPMRSDNVLMDNVSSSLQCLLAATVASQSSEPCRDCECGLRSLMLGAFVALKGSRCPTFSQQCVMNVETILKTGPQQYNLDKLRKCASW